MKPLADQLTRQLGIEPDQVERGLAALFKLAQEKRDDPAFRDLISSASAAALQLTLGGRAAGPQANPAVATAQSAATEPAGWQRSPLAGLFESPASPAAVAAVSTAAAGEGAAQIAEELQKLPAEALGRLVGRLLD